MQDSFDPYAQWLGFPQGRPPANHYELLGIQPLESDAEVISHAADCLKGQIRSIRPGPNLAAWQHLLDQLGAAKACLLDPRAKAAYDAGLRGQGAPAPASPPAPTPGQGAVPMATPPMATPPGTPPQYGYDERMPAAPVLPQGPEGQIPPGAIRPQQPAWQGTWASAPQPPQAQGASPAVVNPPGAPGQPPWPAYSPPQPVPGPAPDPAAVPPMPYGAYPYPAAEVPPPAPGPVTSYGSEPPRAPDPAPLAGPPSTGWYAPGVAGNVPPQTPPGAPPAAYGQVPPPADPWTAPPGAPGAAWGQMPPPGAPGGAYDQMPPAAYGQMPPDPAMGVPPAPLPVGAEPLGSPYAQTVAPAGDESLLGPEGAGGGMISAPPPARPKAGSPLKALAVFVLLAAAAGLGLVLYHVISNDRAEVAGGADGGVSGDREPGPGKAQGKAPKQKTVPEPTPKTRPDPKPKPGPGEKPSPKPGPGEKPKPPEKSDPKEKPKPPVDPAKQTALRQALADARMALSERDLATAQEHLNAAGANAQTPEDRAAVARLTALRGHLEQFWEGIRKSVAGLESGEELVIGETRVAVVEATRDRLIVKAGTNHVWSIEQIPTSLVRVLAQRWFSKEASSKFLIGAFLAVDPKGDREQARRLLRESGQSGLDVKGLLEELDQFGPGKTPGGPAAAQKTAPPADAAKIKQAGELVRQTYKKEYDGANSAVEKFQLARKLLKDAPGTKDNEAARYVMFREARDLAIAAGKATVACEAIDGMARFYTVDPLALKVAALTDAAESAKTLSAHKEVAQCGLALVQAAIDAKRLDEALRLAALAAEAAKKARSAPMIKEALSFQQYVKTLKGQ